MFRVAWWLALGWATCWAISRGLAAAGCPEPGEITSELLFYGVTYIVVAKAARDHLGDPWSELIPLRGMAPRLLIPVVMISVGGLLVAFQLVQFCFEVNCVRYVALYPVGDPVGSESPVLWRALIANAALPALFEEALVRGVVLHALATSMSKRRAIAVSALYFAIMHFDLERMPDVLLSGALYGWMFVRTGSLLPGIVAHALHNAMVTLLARMDAIPNSEHSFIPTGDYGLLPAWLVLVAVTMMIGGVLLMRRWWRNERIHGEEGGDSKPMAA